MKTLLKAAILSVFASSALVAHSQNWVLGGNVVTSNAAIGTNTNFSLLFRTNGVERMRLNQVGDLLLNVPTAIPASGAKLYIRQGWSDWVQFKRTADNGFWSFHNPQSQSKFDIRWTAANGSSFTALGLRNDGGLSLGEASLDNGPCRLAIKQGWSDWIELQRTADAGFWRIHNPQEQDRLSFFFTNAQGEGGPGIFFTNTGKVSIGVFDATKWVPGYKLYVAEGILTEKLKVALSSTSDWADYVFHPDYKLMPLQEVSTYIEENGHLPGIPSAEEMLEQGGMDVLKTNALLLSKIEELTLYVIQLEAKMDELRK